MKKTELITAMNKKLEKLDKTGYTSWIQNNLPYRLQGGVFNLDDIAQVEICLKSLVEKLRNPQYPHGSFIEALARGDIKEAVMVADETNKLAMHTYVIFITTFIPQGLIKMK
jgi:hypothetical protein